MNKTALAAVPIAAQNISKTFRRKNGAPVPAVADLSLEVRAGTLTALVGPDAAGKTTVLRMAAGLMPIDSGRLEVLGINVQDAPDAVQQRIGYMPQKFGLYEDLSVQENLDLYADIHGIGDSERDAVYARLMRMTALNPFRTRLAGRLSGGMKQKLGLACTLVRSPELLLLDEPTVGVDPLSRRELWEIVTQLVKGDGLTVLMTTSYLDEAAHCDHTVVMRSGHAIFAGPPAAVAARAKGRTFVTAPRPEQAARAVQAWLIEQPGVVDAVPFAGRVRFVTRHTHPGIKTRKPSFEDGFMVLLNEAGGRIESPAGQQASGTAGLETRPVIGEELGESFSLADTDGPMQATGVFTVPDEYLAGSADSASVPVRSVGEADGNRPVVEVDQLVRCFGDFTAVDRLSFQVGRGEVFGLLGPNGAGKTTTFRMLCGLLPATDGSLRVAGANLRTSRAAARQRIGYMAQKFSLYSTLTVRENLDFFARAYGLSHRRKRERRTWALDEFGLTSYADVASGELPGGFKQRLALATALLHEPDILFLDEPTSGADPVARREFWVRINRFAEQGVTIVVTTHFMEEAEYCDRLLILQAGSVLAEGTPASIREQGRNEFRRRPTMEDAFIAIVTAARNAEASSPGYSG